MGVGPLAAVKIFVAMFEMVRKERKFSADALHRLGTKKTKRTKSTKSTKSSKSTKFEMKESREAIGRC